MLFIILSNMPFKYTLYFYKILVFLYRHTYIFIYLFIYFYLTIFVIISEYEGNTNVQKFLNSLLDWELQILQLSAIGTIVSLPSESVQWVLQP